MSKHRLLRPRRKSRRSWYVMLALGGLLHADPCQRLYFGSSTSSAFFTGSFFRASANQKRYHNRERFPPRQISKKQKNPPPPSIHPFKEGLVLKNLKVRRPAPTARLGPGSAPPYSLMTSSAARSMCRRSPSFPRPSPVPKTPTAHNLDPSQRGKRPFSRTDPSGPRLKHYSGLEGILPSRARLSAR